MSEQARLDTFATVVVMLLLGLTAFANTLLLLVVSVILLVAGLVLLPRYRTRGMIAALIWLTGFALSAWFPSETCHRAS